MKKPYYFAYEERYQKVYEAGAELWGHSPNDEVLFRTIEKWVEDNHLYGKKVIEFACGEGAAGVILSKLGCIYHGVDIAPSALKKARTMLIDYPDAVVTEFDMVNGVINEIYDAAIDIMGLHMLVTDDDRMKYLKNAYQCLRPNSPMLFFRELYSCEEPEMAIHTYEEWIDVSKADYTTLQQRFIENGENKVEVWIPLVPGREKSKKGYLFEIQKAGFIVQDFVEMDINNQCTHSATIFAFKS